MNYCLPETQQAYLQGYQDAIAKAAAILMFDFPEAHRQLLRETLCQHCAQPRPIREEPALIAGQKPRNLCADCEQYFHPNRKEQPE